MTHAAVVPLAHRRVAVPLNLAPQMRMPAAADVAIFDLGGRTMGTTWSCRLVGPAALTLPDIRIGIEYELDRVIRQMSTWDPASDICAFNRAAPGTSFTLDREFAAVLACALETAETTDGAYDPTVAPLVDLWGFGPPGARAEPPAAADVAAARVQCGWARLAFDPATRRLRQPGGVALDFSAIAKGFAVDQVADALRRRGFAHFLIEIGGELYGEGVKPDGAPWWVALEPFADLEEIAVAAHGVAIATSGDTQRFFESAGMRYAHTIDPRTGYPVAHGCASVNVVERSCMRADALATALTVMTPAEAAAFAAANGIAARIVTLTADGCDERISPALAAMLA